VQHWTTNKISSLPRIIIIFPLMGLFFTEIENIISNLKTRFNRQIHGLRENFRTLHLHCLSLTKLLNIVPCVPQKTHSQQAMTKVKYVLVPDVI
jgi:hypothetical protein